MPRCKGCNQDVVFIKTPAGKWMICDPERCSSETMQECDKIVTTGGEVFHVGGLQQPVEGYRPHWGSCPKARELRRRAA